jgi:hypothetical protein
MIQMILAPFAPDDPEDPLAPFAPDVPLDHLILDDHRTT